MMTSSPIRINFVSDVHFGIRSISQEEMAISFCETIFPLLSETDIFFINGDFFDTLVVFDNHGFDPIYETIMGIFHLCQQHDVKLRVLQGTWTHDRNQCKRFETFYRNGHYTFDFRFIGSIDLEEITIGDRTLRVGYVPDDLPFKSSDAIVEVIKEKMTERGWDYLDYACMHGFFDFTFPKNISQDNVIVFREDQFPFVRKMIDVGHVHQHQIKGNVISNGSFDRLCFGDEDPKGCIKVLDYPEYYTAHFIKNKDAAVYDTIHFDKEDTTETIIERLSTRISSLSTKRKISIRCVVEVLEHREAIKSWLAEVYPDIRCVLKTSEECKDKPSVLPSTFLITSLEKRISPTPKTIASFIRNHIPEDYVLTIEDIEMYLEPA